MNTYEIFTRKFSKIVQASDIRNAVQKFRTMYRESLEIIAIVNVEYSKEFI